MKIMDPFVKKKVIETDMLWRPFSNCTTWLHNFFRDFSGGYILRHEKAAKSGEFRAGFLRDSFRCVDGVAVSRRTYGRHCVARKSGKKRRISCRHDSGSFFGTKRADFVPCFLAMVV